MGKSKKKAKAKAKANANTDSAASEETKTILTSQSLEALSTPAQQDKPALDESDAKALQEIDEGETKSTDTKKKQKGKGRSAAFQPGPNDVPSAKNTLRGVHTLITGGASYLGRQLAGALLRRGVASVTLFDIREPPAEPDNCDPSLCKRIRTLVGDVCNRKQLERAFVGIDVVFHVASLGMSAEEQIHDPRKIYAVNVRGTENVIAACYFFGIPRLVYTSTYNVCFGGADANDHPIVNGNEEKTPYLPLTEHCDEYSKTKAIAEQAVLKASGVRLCTCAVRPAGIYGEKEERTLPRIVEYMQRGLYKFRIGPPTNLVDWVYIDNLVDAHLLAADKLLHSASPPIAYYATSKKRNSSSNQLILKPGVAAGEAYFVSNGEPVNQFKFLEPLAEAVGSSSPSLELSHSFMYKVAILIELLYRVLSPIVSFRPLLTRGEVNKVGVTHFFSIDKAKKQLGYKPRVTNDEGMKRVCKHYQVMLAGNTLPRPSHWVCWFMKTAVWLVLVLCVIGYAVFYAVSNRRVLVDTLVSFAK